MDYSTSSSDSDWAEGIGKNGYRNLYKLVHY